MARYQMVFDTLSGEKRHDVQIDDDEVLEGVLEEILFELRDRGDILKGDGEPQVTWNGRVLDPGAPLTQQGVYPNDLLRVSVISING